MNRRKRGIFNRSEFSPLEINTRGYWHICLNVNFQTWSLAILLVIANAPHLNQVFLIRTASNYPIHLKGTLPFNINHSVRLHQLHCVLVTAAAEWWMCALWAPGPVACLDSGSYWSGRDLVIWDMHSPYRSSHLHCQLPHPAVNSVQVYLKNKHLKNYLMGHFNALLPACAI